MFFDALIGERIDQADALLREIVEVSVTRQQRDVMSRLMKADCVQTSQWTGTNDQRFHLLLHSVINASVYLLFALSIRCGSPGHTLSEPSPGAILSDFPLLQRKAIRAPTEF
jgi:hypothetical protein